MTLTHFALALTASDIKIYIFDHQQIGQGYVVQLSQRRQSMANVKICKRHFFNSDFQQRMTGAHDCDRLTNRNAQKHGSGQAHKYRRNLPDLPKYHCTVEDYFNNILNEYMICYRRFDVH